MEPLEKHDLAAGPWRAPDPVNLAHSWCAPGRLLGRSWPTPGMLLAHPCMLLPAPGALLAHSWCASCSFLACSWPTTDALLAGACCVPGPFCLQNCGHATKQMSPHAGPAALDLHSGCSWPTPLGFCPSLVRSWPTPDPTAWTPKRVPKAREYKRVTFQIQFKKKK